MKRDFLTTVSVNEHIFPYAADCIPGGHLLTPQKEALCKDGLVYAGLNHHAPFLLCGIYQIWPGVGEAWILANLSEPPRPIFTIKLCRMVIEQAFKQLSLHRLQIDFSVKDHKNLSMPLTLGFEYEGNMTAFSPNGEDRAPNVNREKGCPMPVIPIAMVGLAVAGTAASVMAAQQQAKAQQQSANYNAQVQSSDAQVSSYQRQMQEQEYARQSQITQQTGAEQSSRMEMNNGALEARNIASAGSSGLAVTGSTADSIRSSAFNHEMDVQDQQYKVQVEAFQNQIGASTASYNSQVQEHSYQDQAQLDVATGKNAIASGNASSVGAIISGAGKGLEANSFFD